MSRHPVKQANWESKHVPSAQFDRHHMKTLGGDFGGEDAGTSDEAFLISS